MVPVGDVWVGKTEVTWDEFETYYLSEPEDADAVVRPSPSYEPYDRGWGRGGRPAVGISRNAAQRYCEWLSRKTGRTYRLPTEAEWTRACGAAQCGAWIRSNSGGMTREVATKTPNAHGLFDMLGNAWEYCSGPEPILRGGCFDDATATCASRRTVPPEWNERDPQRPRSQWWLVDGPFVGFRLARSVR